VHLRVVCLASAVDYGVETIVFVSSVLDSTNGAIRVMDGVFSLHNIAITSLPLRFVVTGMGIVNCIVKLVLRVSLEHMD
jgi:hypothetical protein